jgi:uncharacterized coiled-coil protein SlyX
LNTSGESNAAVGAFALYNNTTGNVNTATGIRALQNNTTGAENTATGTEALLLNTTGAANTANGAFALANCTGHHNTALGADAGSILTTGNNNIYIGDSGAATDTNTIAIGNLPPAGFADYTRCFIGNAATLTFMQGGAAFGGTVNMSGLTANEGLTDEVRIDASGRLWIGFASSARFKKDIHPMGNTSEAIYSLKPVTFRYKADTTNTLLFGLVAEDVMKVSAALTTLDKEGKPITVHYDQINAMLLNEFLKEHKAFVEEQRKVQELEANAVQQQRKFAQQQKQIEALTAGLQKVSAQLAAASPSGGGLDLSRSASQMAENNQ